jgi:alkanesulfonate monooxygenase SsuD/methylene tetrahydromethanopterin reductase-like flavin-dependent oxidoreductase (luciferase family)
VRMLCVRGHNERRMDGQVGCTSWRLDRRKEPACLEEVTSRYDNYHHGLEHAAQAEAIPADFLSRFCVIGSPESCTERLCRLVELGLSRLVIVGGSRDIDATVRERSDHLVAREILPALQAVALHGKPAELGIDL